MNTNKERRTWTGSVIKCIPFVKASDVQERRLIGADGEPLSGEERRVATFEDMIRQLRLRVRKSGKLERVRERTHYVKPSERKREKKDEQEYRTRQKYAQAKRDAAARGDSRV